MLTLIRSIRPRTGLVLAAASLGLAAFLAGCGGGGSGASGGTLHLSLTDAPSCGYDSVNVTIQKVRVHQSSTANENDAGWSEIVLPTPKRVDLLTLNNGILTDLGQTPLPVGKYTQMRLVLAANDSAHPLANSVAPTGGSEVPLTTPSGQQTGLKLNIDITIAADRLADFVLDFDACKSVVQAGATGSYLLKPVISVIPHYVSGVQGYVDAALGMSTTSVSVQQGGVVVKSTTPDSTGKFLLAPVAPGTYDVVIASSGHATAIIRSVAVATDTVTSINAATSVVSPPVSATGTATGAVATGTTPIDAIVRAQQTLSIGDTIVVASGPVNATTGTYSFALATGAPVVAAYVAAPGTLTFAADTAVAGKYTIAATSGGVTKTVGPVAIAAGASVTANFTFP